MLYQVLQCVIVNGVKIGDKNLQSLDLLLFCEVSDKAPFREALLHQLLTNNMRFQGKKERFQSAGEDHWIVHVFYVVILTFPGLK